MNFLNLLVLALLIGFTVACNAEEKKVETTQVTNSEVKAEVKEEDCEDKAKKKVEITPESITLGSGTTGCSLDEAK